MNSAMKIIISPAKKMNDCDDWSGTLQLPVFVEKAEKLKNYIGTLSREEAAGMWKCNEKLTELNYQRFKRMDLRANLTPALLAYEGIQYQYMAPSVFNLQQWEYVKHHLRILSGFYGILRPEDGVACYRLEMQARGKFPFGNGAVPSLYQFWNRMIYDELAKDGGKDEGVEILNLASKEYSKAVEPYLKKEDRFITCVFGSIEEGRGGKKIKVKGTEAKMARGEMVRFMAEHQIEKLEEIKAFDRLGYQFREEWSGKEELVFCKDKKI